MLFDPNNLSDVAYKVASEKHKENFQMVLKLEAELKEKDRACRAMARDIERLRCAIAEALRIASDENNERYGGDLRLRESAILSWKDQAQAALGAEQKASDVHVLGLTKTTSMEIIR